MEPWKRVRGSRTSRRGNSFNGATAMEPWKSDEQDRHRENVLGFNGATAMEPWKRLPHRRIRRGWGTLQWGHGNGAVEEFLVALCHVSPLLASMGPRQWSRGRGDFSWSAYHATACFNGATAMEPWKSEPLNEEGPGVLSFNGATAMEPWKSEDGCRRMPVSQGLQWGHGNGAVEEFDSEELAIEALSASMGPRQWSRGRGRRRQRRHRRQFPTSMGPRQWSRGRGPRGTSCPGNEITSMGPRQWSRGRGPKMIASPHGSLRLQWGHGNGAVEEARVLQARKVDCQTSMGPRQWSRGRGELADPKGGDPETSMGPRQWSRGRAKNHRSQKRRRTHFNGATAMEPWKSQPTRAGEGPPK